MKQHIHCFTLATIVICLIMTGSILFAEDTNQPIPLSLSYAIELATTQNEGLEGNKIDVTAALRRAQASWASYLPSISVVTSARATGSLISHTGSLSSSAALGLSLTFDGTNKVDEKILQSTYGTTKVAYEQASSSLVVAVSKAYWTLVAVEKSIAVLQNNLQVAQEQYQKNQQSYEAGLIPELDVLKSLISLKSAENLLQSEKDSYDEAFNTFKLLLCVDPEASYEISGKIDPQKLALPTARDLYTAYVEQRYDIQLQRLAVKKAALSLSEKKISTYTPSVTLSGGWDIGLSTTSSISDNASFSVAVSIPVNGYITGSAPSLNLLDSADAISHAQLSLSTGLSEAYTDIQKNVTTILRLWAGIETQIQNLDILNRTYELSQDAYDSGLVSITELNESRQEVLEANKALVEANLSYVLSTYNLATALGMDIDTLTELYGITSESHETSQYTSTNKRESHETA